MEAIGWCGLAFFSIIFLICVILLCKKEEVTDELNSFGVDKASGRDRKYAKYSKILIVVAIISIGICALGSYAESYEYAKNAYNLYTCDGNDEERQQKVQQYLNKAERYTKANPSLAQMYLSDADDYLHPGDSWKDYFDWDIMKISFWVQMSIIVLLGVLSPLYLYPTKVARRNEHEQAIALTWINAIFGCTVIGWVAMLIWANSAKKAEKFGGDDLGDKLNQLSKLKTQGLITQEEFDTKKKELLDKM